MEWGLIALRWGVLLVGVGLIWLALQGLAGIGRLIAGVPGVTLVAMMASGACSPALVSVGDDSAWTIYSELGLPVTVIPPDEPRSVRNTSSATDLSRDATHRLTAHTGAPAVDTIEINAQWLEIATARGTWSIPDLPMKALGYDPFESLVYLHHYGRVPPHTLIAGAVAFPRVPDHPLMTTLKAGDAIDAFDRDAWWPARVLAIDPARGVQVHYDGYGAEWDAWLWPHRVRPRGGVE